MKTKLKGAETKLEKSIQTAINQYVEGYETGATGFLKDLAYGGCQSGMVGGLIYYTDTVKFYKKHRNEINALLKETLSELGYDSPAQLFGNKWDSDDIFAEAKLNQNLLAWFGFEETARKLAEKNNIEF